ncbi:hypothetical protein [Nocardia carnea]|uniref:hypothetical protein n=1 Tax=Nocardia carnea TaxID=37328 RepID=UPI002457B61E|nr:hypothetical protein [Nocardia carnea]
MNSLSSPPDNHAGEHLDYTVVQTLEIPDEAYTDDVAVVVVTGGSYGGAWVLNAISPHLPPDKVEPIGSIETAQAPRRPDLALEAAHHWIRESCTQAGLALAHFKELNSAYSPAEAPFFSSGQFLIDRRSTPQHTESHNAATHRKSQVTEEQAEDNLRRKPSADDPAAAVEAVLIMQGPSYGFALLDGAPLAGVTRSMFEAVKATAPTARLINTDVTRLAEIVDTPTLFEQMHPDEQYVVWLDDLSPADLNLLGTGILDRICQRAAVIANINTAVCDRILADRSPVTGPARTALLEYATRKHVSFELSQDERKAVQAIYPNVNVTTSIGEALVGGNVVVHRYHEGITDNPDGHTLVQAAIDARRCGIHRGLTETELRELFNSYCGGRRSRHAFTQALTWASDVPPGASVGLIARTEGGQGAAWKVLGYAAGADDGDHGFTIRPIPDSGWTAILKVLAKSDGYALGIGAHLRNQPDTAVAAFTEATRHPGTCCTAAAAALKAC